jgi:hypothetical protein
MPGMKIKNVSNLIVQCWDSAELTVRQEMESKHPDKNEEFITELFQDELRIKLESASASGAVERAFLMDLEAAFPNVMSSDLSRISNGLVALVNFHARSVEGKTGGDFGLVLVRPDVSHARFGGSDLMIDEDYQRGLLCQAKILGRDAKWGDLTRSQKRVLTDRMGYFGLVLYEYLDSDRRKISEFHWQLAAGNSIEDVTRWLKTGQFPDLRRSAQILGSLAQDRIGTDDKKIIAEFIAPPTRPSLEIRVTWRDGDGPGPTVHTHVNSHVEQHVIVRH